jgi:hypothetical protein
MMAAESQYLIPRLDPGDPNGVPIIILYKSDEPAQDVSNLTVNTAIKVWSDIIDNT